MNFEHIQKNSEIIIIDENDKSKKVDTVALVQDGNIFCKISNYYIQIPQEMVKTIDENKILLNLKKKEDYKEFLYTAVAKCKGEKLISKFEVHFPKGKNYEVYDFSRSLKISRCSVNEDWLKVLTHRYRWTNLLKSHSFEIFAEIDLKLESELCFFYSFRKNLFGFFELHQEDKIKMHEFMDFYNKDWVTATRYNFNPVSFIMYNDRFRVGVIKWGKIFDKIFKKIQKNPHDPLNIINSTIEKNLNPMKKYPLKFELPITEEIYKQLVFINQVLIPEINYYLPSKASTGKKAIAALTMPVWMYFSIGQIEPEFEPLYIVPNGDKTIIALFLPRPDSWRPNPFINYERSYELIKKIYELLKKENTIFCPNCGWKCELTDNHCVNCGYNFRN